ncbi:reverse transcriptase [Sesbania bispinosa]|nr:reverse transcriptase [Sesbania bispinosa]
MLDRGLGAQRAACRSLSNSSESARDYGGFHLGDKVCLDGKGDDMAQQKRPKVKYMYRRRYRGDAANQDPGGEK